MGVPGAASSRRRRGAGRWAALTGAALLGAGALVATAAPAHAGDSASSGPSLVVVGASYSAGVGASSPQLGYAPLLARRLGLHLVLDAAPGTGFVTAVPRYWAGSGAHGRAGHHHWWESRSGGPSATARRGARERRGGSAPAPDGRRTGTIGQRLQEVPATVDARLVLLQGGRNDTGTPPSAEERAAEAAVRAARARFPAARVVVLGPVPAGPRVHPGLLVVDRSLARACAATGATWVDPVAQRWVTPADAGAFRGPVPDHPGDRGYADIAARIAADLDGSSAHPSPPRTAGALPRSPV